MQLFQFTLNTRQILLVTHSSGILNTGITQTHKNRISPPWMLDELLQP